MELVGGHCPSGTCATHAYCWYSCFSTARNRHACAGKGGRVQSPLRTPHLLLCITYNDKCKDPRGNEMLAFSGPSKHAMAQHAPARPGGSPYTSHSQCRTLAAPLRLRPPISGHVKPYQGRVTPGRSFLLQQQRLCPQPQCSSLPNRASTYSTGDSPHELLSNPATSQQLIHDNSRQSQSQQQQQQVDCSESQSLEHVQEQINPWVQQQQSQRLSPIGRPGLSGNSWQQHQQHTQDPPHQHHRNQELQEEQQHQEQDYQLQHEQLEQGDDDEDFHVQAGPLRGPQQAPRSLALRTYYQAQSSEIRRPK